MAVYSLMCSSIIVWHGSGITSVYIVLHLSQPYSRHILSLLDTAMHSKSTYSNNVIINHLIGTVVLVKHLLFAYHALCLICLTVIVTHRLLFIIVTVDIFESPLV